MGRRALWVVLALGALGLALERWIVTDIEAIEALVARGQEAFNEKDFETLLDTLDDDFAYGERDRAETAAHLRKLATRFQAAGIDVVMDEPQVDADADPRTASATARIRARVMNRFAVVPVSLRFVRRGDEWRLQGAARLPGGP